jgi:hypothetical protein
MALASSVSLGAELFTYFALGFYLAPKLGHRFGMPVFFKVLGLIVGVGCPVNALVRIVRIYNKQQQKEDDEHRTHKHD